MKIVYILFTGLFLFTPFNIFGQSVYDSLRQVYNDTYLFDKFYNNKRQASFEDAIHYELRTIWNDSIRDLAVVSVYENAFGYNWTDSTSLNNEIDSIINNSYYPEIRKHAILIRERANIPLIGRDISGFGLPDNSGDTVFLDSFKGNKVILSFWAAWNSSSTKDMKRMSAFMKKYEIQFYSISLDEEFRDLVRFVKQRDYAWPIVFAGRGSNSQYLFKVRHLPKYITVDKDGIIINESFDSIEEAVESAQ